MPQKRKTYTEDQAKKALAKISGWQLNKAATQITKKFECANFIAALAFCAKIGVHAEVVQHHPDIQISYKTVKLKITTHDEKGLTKKDFELATRIDSLQK